jgi:hypothetical protein
VTSVGTIKTYFQEATEVQLIQKMPFDENNENNKKLFFRV